MHKLRAIAAMVSFGFVAVAGGPGSAQDGNAAQEAHYRLSATVLACFVEHREIYKAASGDPVFLIADRCPPERPPSLLDALTNEGPDVRLGDANALDRLLTLNREQLACLDRLSVAANSAVVLFYPDACRVEAIAGDP